MATSSPRFHAVSRRATLATLVSLLAAGSASARLPYPVSARDTVADDYNGTRVADPYRWLENDDSPQTVEWVDAQNALTRSVLDAVPGRDALRRRLTELYDFPKAGVPVKRGARYFYTRNTGLQNQSVFYVQEGPGGTARPLIDPNGLSPDGTVALTRTEPSDDGSKVAYALSSSGSDHQEILVRDVATGKDLSDRLGFVRFTSMAWTPDNAGFYYTRFPNPGSVPKGDENYFARIYYHRIGQPQDQDSLVFERPDRKEAFLVAQLSADGRFLVLSAFMGSSNKAEVSIVDRSRAPSAPKPLFTGFANAYQFIDAVDGKIYFRTDQDAPHGRVIAVDGAHLDAKPAEILGEAPDRLSDAQIVHHRLVALRLHNVCAQAAIYTLDGKREAEVPLPALGSIQTLTGRPGDREMFFDFESFVQPATIYRYDLTSHTRSEFQRPTLKFKPEDFETEQVWYPSKDGTKVSMFIVHRKGLKMDGNRPTWLTGYGGFDISSDPSFSPALMVWLERGGMLAVANLRGGGEYGEAWHEAGMLERKQNVFDDFIAAAEWLVKSGYTRKERLAIEGGSNGGLLVSACEVQRPELFGAVLCRVPLTDMLRYQRFTVARFWIPEYGSSEDPKQFAYLFRYSPYHNVRDGVSYPPTLITTADHDDRVAPLHAKKFAARMQAATGGTAPILIRIETKAGHGQGKPTSKRIDEYIDLFSFLFVQLGMTELEAKAG